MGGYGSKDRQLATQQYEHHTWVTAKHPRTRQQCVGAPTGARTQDPRIKSPLLYQLSYRGQHCLSIAG